MESIDEQYEAKVQRELDRLVEKIPECVRKPEEFEIMSEIGKGGFGRVMLAKFKETGQLYAYKEIFEKRLEGRQFRHYIDEALTMSKCHNPFVLELFGFTLQPPYAIITPYMKNGSLSNLFEKKKVKLSPTDKTKIAMGIAHGMHHVNGKNIYHRDLKTGNVLLDENMYPKICDFGIARLATGDDIHLTGKIGTPISMAPELQTSTNYTAKVDVYAYSIILYELIHGKKPYKGMKIIEFQQKVLIGGERAPIDKNTPQGLANLVQRCWAQDPNERPTFGEIYKEFVDGKAYFEGTDPKEIADFDAYANKQTKIIERDLRAKLKARLIKEHKKKEEKAEREKSESQSSPPNSLLPPRSLSPSPNGSTKDSPESLKDRFPFGYTQKHLFSKKIALPLMKQHSVLKPSVPPLLLGPNPTDEKCLPVTRFGSYDDLLRKRSSSSSEEMFNLDRDSDDQSPKPSQEQIRHQMMQNQRLELHRSESFTHSQSSSPREATHQATAPPLDLRQSPKSYYPGLVQQVDSMRSKSFILYPPSSPRQQKIASSHRSHLDSNIKSGYYIAVGKGQNRPFIVRKSHQSPHMQPPGGVETMKSSSPEPNEAPPPIDVQPVQAPSTLPFSVQSPKVNHTPFQKQAPALSDVPVVSYPKFMPPFNVQSPPPPSSVQEYLPPPQTLRASGNQGLPVFCQEPDHDSTPREMEQKQTHIKMSKSEKTFPHKNQNLD